MRCVSWEEFLASSESCLEEALRCGSSLYVRRGGRIVLEIVPAVHADQAEEDGGEAAERGSLAERWLAEQVASDNL